MGTHIHSVKDRIKKQQKLVNSSSRKDVTASIIMQPLERLHLCIRLRPTTESTKVIIHRTGTGLFPLRGGIIEKGI